MNIDTTQTLKFYVIVNSDGKFFRSKGYGGYGNNWVDELGKAKIYSANSGAAKAQVTYWAKNYPEYGVPKIIELTATITDVIDQRDRVKKSIEDKKIRELKRKEAIEKYKYNEALRKLEDAQKELKKYERI